MKLIESEVIIKEQEPGIDGIYKQIEWAGRHCYKSHDKITEDSAKEFVDRMIKSKHGAMLEHGTVYLDCPQHVFIKYIDNPYSKCEYTKSHIEMDEEYCSSLYYTDKQEYFFVTTNMRVLVENNWLDDLKYLCEPTEYHEKRISARFTCDMGVGRELTRHRTLSFAQESTRYCNYSKSKFDNELTFIKPYWMPYSNSVSGDEFKAFADSLAQSEISYLELIKLGRKPQEARQVLPLALKTEIVVTGFESDWEHFFSLRSPKYGAQGVHPDMAKLADELYEKLNNVNTDNKTE